MTEERRQIPRAPSAISVELLGTHARALAHDVSLGGMLISTDYPRWPGQLVQVRFRLPDQTRAIRATCRVMALVDTPRGMGLALKFLRLATEAQLALHRYIDRRPAEPPSLPSLGAVAHSWVNRIVEDCAQLGALARP